MENNNDINTTSNKTGVQRPLWQQPNFMFLFSSQTTQSVAFILLQVVVMVEVYTRTGSVFGSSLVPAISALGSFLGGALGSYYIHKFSQTRLLQGIGLLRALAVLLLGVVLSLEGNVWFLLFAILFFQSLIGSWYQPARFALLPLVVSKAQYMKANGTLALIHQMFLTAGWALGGVLILLIPFAWMIALVAVLFLLSGVLISMISLSEHAKLKIDGREGQQSSAEGKDKPIPAWKKVFQYPIIRTVTMMDFFENLANVIWTSAFILIFTTEILNKGTEWWGFINAAYWIGAIIGSITVISITSLLEKRVGAMIAVSSLVMGVMTLLFAVFPFPWLALALCVLMGPVYQAREICQETIMQDVLKDGERANVMAARNAILTPWYSLTFLIMGFLGDVIGIQWVFILGGALYLLTFLIAMLQRNLREYRYVVEENERNAEPQKGVF